MVRKKLIPIAIVIIVIVVVLGIYAVLAPPPAVKIWRWGTADPGSYGYKVSAFMADFLRRDMPDWDITVYPYATTTANIKDFTLGNLESTYAADVLLTQLYEFTGPWEGFKPEVKKMPVQTFWAYTMETHFLILKGKEALYTKWGDLEGKKVYLTPAGYGNHMNIRRSLLALGIVVEHVEVATDKVIDALEAGTIEAFCCYTTNLVSLPTWGKTEELKMELKPLNPSPAETATLTAAGLTPVKIDVKKAYVKNKGMGDAYGIPFYFGYHAGTDFPEKDAYRWLICLENNAGFLAKLDPGFAALKADFAGFQVKGIKSVPTIPVHPGLARYLKEKGLWEAEWKIAK